MTFSLRTLIKIKGKKWENLQDIRFFTFKCGCKVVIKDSDNPTTNALFCPSCDAHIEQAVAYERIRLVNRDSKGLRT